MPALVQLDFGISWIGTVGAALTEARLEILGAQPRQVLDYSLVRDASTDPVVYRRLPRHLPGRTLSISARLVL